MSIDTDVSLAEHLQANLLLHSLTTLQIEDQINSVLKSRYSNLDKILKEIPYNSLLKNLIFETVIRTVTERPPVVFNGVLLANPTIPLSCELVNFTKLTPDERLVVHRLFKEYKCYSMKRLTDLYSFILIPTEFPYELLNSVPIYIKNRLMQLERRKLNDTFIS